jgi:hypothetical protein
MLNSKMRSIVSSLLCLQMLASHANQLRPLDYCCAGLFVVQASSGKSSGASFGRSDSSSGRSSKSSGGLFACFKSSPVQEDEAYHAGTGAAVNATHAAALTGPLSQPWAGECMSAACLSASTACRIWIWVVLHGEGGYVM